MPCFSAYNLRVAAAQQQQIDRKNRSKTATNRSQTQSSWLVQQPQQETSLQHECSEFLKVMGYSPAETSKGKRVQKLMKPDMSKTQTVLPPKELDRLKNAAKITTLDDRLDALVKAEAENLRLEKEAERLRQHFKKIDDERKRALEANAQKKREEGAVEKLRVLERSFLAKHEQEEEVKRATRLMLNAKCHAVQDAQIQERMEIERELRNEEIRLGKMVLEGAAKALNEEDKKIEKKKEEKEKYACEIRKQLNERENLRFLEAERLEQEARMIRKAGEAIKREDERQAELAKERRAQLRDELKRISEMSALFKKMLCEQEREADMRVAAYLREKQQRELALEAEKKLAKEAKERRRQRIYMLAQKLLESRTTSEELNYLREQEKIEREYRRKEKEAAMRKKQLEKDLADARERQLQETKHRQALQIARAEQDFNMLIEQVKEAEEKQKQREAERERQSMCYRQAIIRQMNEKELERRRLLELERAQAFAWRESERQRDSNIRSVINAKLDAMRDACLPEKYIKEVEKQLQKIANSKSIVQK